MDGWNYRIVKYDNTFEECYGVHEVYYNATGGICGRMEDPIITSESVDGLLDELAQIIQDVAKSRDDVLPQEMEYVGWDRLPELNASNN